MAVRIRILGGVTTPPLPDVPCIRVRLDYTNGAGTLRSGSRFYLSYSGSAPTSGNLNTLASDIASAWASDLASVVQSDMQLVEVDCLDIATTSGHSGTWSGTNAGTRSGTNLPFQCATNIQFLIARRYRGGKPRMYLPAGVSSDTTNGATYAGAFVTLVNTGVSAFFAAIAALSIGAIGTLQHVNLSFYSGFTNHTGTSGRERAIPTYRATALHDNVTGYAAELTIGSQRRRRTSTTF